MSPKNSFLTVGLTALGLLGYSATRAVYSGDAPAPAGPSPAPATAASHTVLLLSDGRVIQGAITETDDAYVLRQNGGEIRFRKGQVEEHFGSMAEAYQYKRAATPDRDPDEHLKLARWCLVNRLMTEARAELDQVVRLSPDAREAKAMLAALDADAARLTMRPRTDPGLVQTGAEVTQPPVPDGRPGELNLSPADLRAQKLERKMGIAGLPAVFDLPPGLALQRAEQFAQTVHPILQAGCVGCHNEKYSGAFSMLRARNRQDLTPTLLRANLESVLRLVDPQNPASSELLSRAMVPHGSQGRPQPIFNGATDRRYQAIAAWVNSLGASPAKRSPDGVTQARFAADAPEKEGSGGFASERAANPAGPSLATRPQIDPGSITPPMAPRPREIPASRYVPGRGMVAEQAPPLPEEFPVPYMLGGPRPGATPAAVPGAPARPVAAPAAPQVPVAKAPAPAAPPVAAATPGVPATPAADDEDDEAPPTPKKPAKPVKIDPALLEKALMNRNQSR